MPYVCPSQKRIEGIKEKEAEEAEVSVRTQFAMEQILYCQDGVYSQDLNTVKAETAQSQAAAAAKTLPTQGVVPTKENASFTEMAYHLKAYFNVSSDIFLLFKASGWGFYVWGTF